MARSSFARLRRQGFTLVELLVVIGIIALLMSILLPSLGRVRMRSAATKSMSNLRQVGLALEMYKNEWRGYYPRHSSLDSETTRATPPRARTRWIDDIFHYAATTEVYASPLLDDGEKVRMNKPFAHTCDPTTGQPTSNTVYFGGYGYNYQYLGNARKPGGIAPYHANGASIRKPAETIAVSDSNGSKDGGSAWTSEGVYVIDPPRQSMTLGSKGSRSTSADPSVGGNYSYRAGNDGDASRRSTPAERNLGNVNVLFCDGHVVPMKLAEMDDYNGDGTPDNGWWNGVANPQLR
jgi:prepilin-type N-terminal cleavage/methylation domain-containing protein/prepilin-type processing-associated H-X9-DG protein